MANYKIISADSHVQEPDELYQERLPERYKERGPKTVKLDGGTYRISDGQAPIRIDLVEQRLTEEDKKKEFREDREGGTNIHLRLADLELDGITSEIIYPNAIFHIYASPDSGYQLAAARVLNDWQMELFGEYPDKFLPSAVIPMMDLDGATAEVRRVQRKGYRTLSVPVSMPNKPYDEPEYEPFWATVEELGLPLNFHVFTKPDTILEGLGEEEGRGQDLTLMALGMAEAMNPTARLIASGVLQRHSDLRFVLVECGIGWLGWFLYALDELYEKRHMWHRPVLELKPSEFFRRQGYITFGDDPIGLQNINHTGADVLMWGSDYPHDEGTFPHSREVIEKTFRDIAEENKRKIVGGNAARLYNLHLN